MSANLSFIHRFDSGRAGIVDDADVGTLRQDAKGRVVYSSTLGHEIGHNQAVAKREIKNALRLAWRADSDDETVKRLDAATDFVTSGLELVMDPGENVIREAEPTLFVPGPGRVLALPIRNMLKPGMRTNSFKIRTRHGQAEWYDPASNGDVGLASYQDEKEVRGAEYYAAMWQYSIPQTWEGELLGDDVASENQMAAMESLDDFQERVSFWGDVDKNVDGFATIGSAAVLLGGQQFSSLVPTAVQQYQRIAAFEQQYMALNGQRKPTSCLIPDADRYAMQTTFFGDNGGSESVWDRATRNFMWLREGNAYFSNNLLEGNEAGTATRWILFGNDPKNLHIEHMDTMLFGPFVERLRFTFLALRRHGGVVSKYPERVVYVDFTA